MVKAPPALPKAAPVNPVARLLPAAMLVAAVGMVVVYVGSGAGRSPVFLFFPVMMAISVLGTLAYGARGGITRSAEIEENRRSYLRYLDTLDDELATLAAHRHTSQHSRHPCPASLWTRVGGRRMWTADDDTLCVRIGLGPSPVPLSEPEIDDTQEHDPLTVAAMRTLVQRRAVLDGQPVTVSLTRFPLIAVHGDEERARGLVRALVCQLAVAHAPDSLGVVARTDGRADWDWLKWLPHQTYPSCHTVVIVDGGVIPAPEPGTSVVVIGAHPAPARIDVDTATLITDDGECTFLPDGLTPPQATACARRLAPHRDAAAPSSTRRTWWDLTGIAGPDRLDVDTLWVHARGLRPVPVGVGDDGTPVAIDINEAARGGAGPHGLCVGATGSGKSEFLRTLVLGMITAHPPDVLNLVLVDFKGGATFLGLERANHVAAVITNLADEAHLVARMNDTLAGELHRRQELLRSAGTFTNIGEYAAARARGASLPALPALFVVVDEFSELLTQHPDFAELFLAIGRLGRSLGIHLLLASQRLDEGRLRGLDTHLSYRICLKTFSAAESRAVLGVPDAHHLPGTPGAAYLKTADGRLTRFQTAFVSGPCPRPSVVDARPGLFTAHPGAPHAVADDGPTLLDTVLTRVAQRGPAAHRVWLPPLTEAPPVDTLVCDTADLTVAIGLIDSPFQQRYDLLLAELGGGAGHVAIVGAPRSGKSTAVRTLIAALAERHSPTDVAFYCLDFGGGTLSTVADLPHVGAVAGRGDVDLCRRTVAVLEALLRTREERGRGPEDPHVFLVVDGWAHLRQQHEALETAITALAAAGLAYGIHVVVTASRWAELRPALKDQIGTRIELRLGDPADSEMDRRRARALTRLAPGHGITADGRELAIARPVPVRTRWSGRRAPRIELLPTRVAHSDVLAKAADDRRIVVGLGERELTAVPLDFTDQPHLLALGDTGCGKSALLRLLCREIMRTADPAQAQLEIVDFRRALLGVLETDHLSGYAASPAALTSRLPKLLARLEERMPGDTVTQQQLRQRSWWSGPDIYLVIDDYDLVSGATGSPLTPLADFLPHAADLGLHVIVARRSGGAARALFDPVLARMRELGCMGLMMSAGPDEGVLLGTVRPGPLPPGRGTLITRAGGEQLVQVGWTP
ncbi:type VII secretion protein EccCb [Mycolicibacterium phlei]